MRSVHSSPLGPIEKTRTERSLMQNTFPLNRTGLLTLGLSALLLAGCGQSEQPQGSAYKSTSADKAEDKHAATEKPGAQKARTSTAGRGNSSSAPRRSRQPASRPTI